MILLGINCGFGPHDCATLTLSAVDLDGRWIDHPRPKTEVDRSCALWGATVAALRRAIDWRFESDSDRLFVMKDGKPWERSSNPIQKRFLIVRGWAGVTNATFSWLRHTFQTIADGAKDPVAVKHIMGHLDHSMSAVYREEIDRERISAVTDHVLGWFSNETPKVRRTQLAEVG